MNPRDTIARARYGQACDGGYEIVGTAAASAILQDLTAAGYRIVGPADMEKAVDAASKAVVAEWQAFIAEMQPHMTASDAARSFASPGNYRLIRAALTAAAPHMPVPDGWQKHYDMPEHLALDLRQIAENFDCRVGYPTMDAQIMRRAASCFDGHPEEISSSKARSMLSAAPKPAALTQEPKP